jgi:hypothetical protein
MKRGIKVALSQHCNACHTNSWRQKCCENVKNLERLFFNCLSSSSLQSRVGQSRLPLVLAAAIFV